MREVQQEGVNYRIFYDITELMEFGRVIGERGAGSIWKDYRATGEHFKKWEDVIARTQIGDPSLVTEVRKLIDEFEGSETTEPVDVHRRPTYVEDGGDEVDLGRLYGGQAFWRTLKRRPMYGQQVKRLIIQMSTPGSRAFNELYWRGVVGVVVADLLEKAGYQVELWAMNPTKSTYISGKGHCSALLLKDANGPVDLDALCKAISAWFYRTFWFTSKVWTGEKVVSSLGGPRSIYPGDRDAVFGGDSLDEDCLMVHNVWDKYDAKYAVKHLLKNYQEPEPEVEYEPYDSGSSATVSIPEPELTPKQRREMERRRDRMYKEWERESKLREKQNKEGK